MKMIQCHFSSGQREPLLVQAGDAAPLPKLTPFIYVQLKLHRVYSTAAARLRAIQASYSYAESRNLDIDMASFPQIDSRTRDQLPQPDRYPTPDHPHTDSPGRCGESVSGTIAVAQLAKDCFWKPVSAAESF